MRKQIHSFVEDELGISAVYQVLILPTEFPIVKAMVFPVVMYGCKSWTIKKAEHQRTDASELWCC